LQLNLLLKIPIKNVYTSIHKEEFKSILFNIKNETKLLQFIWFRVV